MVKIKDKIFITDTHELHNYVKEIKAGVKNISNAMEEAYKNAGNEIEKFSVLMDFAERQFFYANLCAYALTGKTLQEKAISEADLKQAMEAMAENKNNMRVI